MQVSIFNVPAGDALALEEMNRFLRGHRVLTLDRTWTGAGWSFCVTWQPPAGGTGEAMPAAKVDYKAVLDGPTFALFSRLREIRKALAEKENLPPYAVFTNEQLAAIARARCTAPAELGKIDGIGAARIEKYGAAVLAAVVETGAAPPPARNGP
jgi:superfamily II DNA helicase RecQ